MPTVPPVDPQRRAKVDAAREGWIRALIDKSRRNNLLYFRDLKVGTLDLTGADARSMERLLKQDEVALSKLLPKEADLRVAEAKLGEVRARSVMNSEERGIETLFMAMGMATWEAPDGERPAEAAILLVPIKVEARGRGGQGLALKRNGDIQANLVLLHLLETEFGITVAPEDLLAVLQGDDECEVFDPAPVNELLKQAARGVLGFRTTARIVVGNFAFQKTAMVKDLRESADVMARHDLIAAISGDPGAGKAVRGRRVPADPAEIDRTPPDDEFLFLDADSSQQLVVRNVIELQDGTIQGPPGTGKSQTIANLIAEFAARGRRVLFVAEKRAALEVVLERLREKGLDHLALDLHGAEISRRDVMGKLQASLDRVASVPPVDADKAHGRFMDRRKKLVDHVRRLHRVCAPTGHTVYAVQGRLLRLGAPSLTRTRWRDEVLSGLDAHAIELASSALSELREHRGLFLRISDSPWTGAELIDGAAARRALLLARELATEWPAWFESALVMGAKAGLAQPHSIAHVREVFQLIQDLRSTFDAYETELFTELDLSALAAQLAPAGLSGIRRTWAFIANAGYRRAIAQARRYRLLKRAPAPHLRAEIMQALAWSQRWTPLTLERTPPRPMPEFPEVKRSWESIEHKLNELAVMLRRDDLDSLDLPQLSGLIARLAADPGTPPLLPRLHALEHTLAGLGVGELVEEMRKQQPESDQFIPFLEHAWFSSAIERTMEDDSEFAAFRGRTHDRLVEEFRNLDKERIEIACSRVQRTHAEQAVAVMNTYAYEADVVRRECQKKSRGFSVRRLLQEAPHVMTTLRPCWMASPLSVSHLLPVNRNLFDIVLFDEASQVLPQDAVPALLRAERAVVAGDRHQLPPTTFFLAEEELDAEPDEEAPSQGFESILDLMSGLFEPWTLDWHYRSRDESLIAFSNRHIYANRLVTFPGPGKHRAIEHHQVTQSVVDGQEDSVSAEVMKVVELVVKHASERPAATLGVITLGIKHQQRIERALEEVRRDRPELDEFFGEGKRERFFVKNLERVQGDERDAIILSVGYGKDRSGKLPYRFGPILSEGGERRLNVAVTRARNRMMVVSSFSHHDMEAKRSSAKGVEFLRLYLQFAASGGENLGDSQGPVVPLNEFEQAIHDALTARGVKLLSQWGASRYRIDLVAQHPERAGRHVLAIECDGATYHSAQSARDRDRLRQQHLEALGWRFHRIWSTDWFLNRQDELDRAVEAYEDAVRAADREDSGGVPAQARPAVAPPPTVLQSPARDRRPSIPVRNGIDQYSDDELLSMVQWVASDRLLRTDEQLLDEMIDALGFGRRGARIVARVGEAIASFRR
jgi:very-short-patch-repair endonuclease